MGFFDLGVLKGVCWQEDLFHTHFTDEDEFVTMVDTITRLGQPFEIIVQVSVRKGEGNNYFNQGEFGLATEQYKKAAKLLSGTLMVSSVDPDQCKNLAVSLHLNLAICALKLGSFKRAWDLCCLVLVIDPNNIKGRFRRAKAAIELGWTTRAFEDLTKALSLDPTNKEIHHELGKVVLLYQSNIKGKRKIESLESLEGCWVGALSGGRELDSHCEAPGSEEYVKDLQSLPSTFASTVSDASPSGGVIGVLCWESNAPDIHLNRVATSPSSQMNGCPFKMDDHFASNFVTPSDVVFEDVCYSSSRNLNLAEPMYRFANRQSHDSNLQISPSSYEALLRGRVISYSSHSQFSSLSVRIKHPQTSTNTLQTG